MHIPWQTIALSAYTAQRTNIASPGPLVFPADARVINFKVEYYLDWCPAGYLWCHITPAQKCTVIIAAVSRLYRRRRIGHALMYELEKRFPGVHTTAAKNEGVHSIPSWYALRASIMRTGNPHFGRDDLYPYEPEVFE